jgi:hypothetical protein
VGGTKGAGGLWSPSYTDKKDPDKISLSAHAIKAFIELLTWDIKQSNFLLIGK